MGGKPSKAGVACRATVVWAAIGTALWACGAAQAQDFMPPQSTGDVYIQGFIGGALVQQRQGYYRNSDGQDDVGRSVYGGGGLGYTQHFDNWLVGAEAEIGSGTGDVTTHGGAFDYVTHIDWLATATGRLGYDLGANVVPYISTGLAVGEAGASTRGGASAQNSSDTKAGWTAGAGMEAPLPLSLLKMRLEYRYVDFGQVNGPDGQGGTIPLSLHQHLLRLGLSLRL
ncbi:outer membrane protein [Nitrospirillum sp. BR 11828]|uniref:outer membrane protein n=1 Tax=Nitrospirillum sp. BR 11828 TaxID=3104325 RepID=UPI002ACA7AD3|nr:outer membrane beta-barrel protein [Nitrospirillum sp. BR 11828]MDZ5646906.1 outer membrane beta-barrel protein [Nitrospirillum sp. BR 11828]